MSLSVNVIHANTERTIPVGSYPLGANRNGIMDMPGIVPIWCSDTYLPSAAELHTNLLSQAARDHWVICGGSFGNYNPRQRAQHHDFNHSAYPGYIDRASYGASGCGRS